MNTIALFQLLGDIDDIYVEHAGQPVKKRAVRVWLPVAACAAAVLAQLLARPPLMAAAAPSVSSVARRPSRVYSLR